MMRKKMLLILLVSLIGYSFFAEENAQTIFDQAIELKANGQESGAFDDEAREKFIRSAELYEATAVSEWQQWYEAGNARWWADQADLAILDYRRYLSHDSFRGEVWENLAQARLKALTEEIGNEGFSIWPWFLWFACGASFLGGIAALFFGLFMFFRKPLWRTVSIAVLFVSISFGIISFISFATRSHIAVVLSSTQGRKGDSSVYASFPSDPWKAGQEVWLIEERGSWTRIRVGSTSSWIPSSSLIKIP